MIKSMLDNDAYKIFMQQCVFHNFPNVPVEYDLSIRSDIDLRPFKNSLRRELMELDSMQLHPDEISFLKTIRFLKDDYIEWLADFRYNTNKHITIVETEDNLAIRIKGNWLQTILYEVPLLAIISELYHSRNDISNLRICTERLNDKIAFIKTNCPNMKFADFGTRRRNSFMIHDHVVSVLGRELPNNLVGTSNLHLAMKYGLKPIGTIAHEMLQAAQVLFPLRTHQRDIMDVWNKEFDGDVGIMLSDTLGIDNFLNDFSLKYAKSFDGLRQDSGNPIATGYKIIDHYKKLGIDPKNKTIVFSDGLDFPTAVSLYEQFNTKIIVSFGIGTNLTNDCGEPAISIVIKMQMCNDFPVAKISDTPGKAMCRNPYYIEYLKSVFNF